MTDEDLDRLDVLAAAHQPVGIRLHDGTYDPDDLECAACHEDWPCITDQQAATIRSLVAAVRERDEREATMYDDVTRWVKAHVTDREDRRRLLYAIDGKYGYPRAALHREDGASPVAGLRESDLTRDELSRLDRWRKGEDGVSLESIFSDAAAYPDVSRAVRAALLDEPVPPSPVAGLREAIDELREFVDKETRRDTGLTYSVGGAILSRIDRLAALLDEPVPGANLKALLT